MPMMGRGFIHDDFMHLYSAASQSVEDGLAHSFVKNFYTPITWLTFRLDLLLWGSSHPYPLAFVNLLIHTTNVLLLYRLAWELWKSSIAAWWTGFGFALLFPANTWAVMWIATRAHLLATVFYLAAMLTALWFARTEKRKVVAASAVMVCAALAMFAKESGVTVIAAVCIVILYDGSLRGQRFAFSRVMPLLAALVALLSFYFVLRIQAGALAPSVSNGEWYSYVLSANVLGRNLMRYGWRTYGILTLVALAITASLIIRGARPRLNLLTRHDVLFSLLLFLTAVAPFVLLPGRSGIYTYLPGVGAALLLGVAVRSLYQSPEDFVARRALLALVPVSITAMVCVGFTVGHSLKWMQMAMMTTNVLRQLSAQQPQVKSNTLIVLTYLEADRRHRFPEGFAEWGFPFAVKLLYRDSTLDAKIIRGQETRMMSGDAAEIHFAYTLENGAPKIIKTSEVAP